MKSLNFNHLRYFWAVAHEGNLTRAAERLNLSQSALSVQIQKLEHLHQPREVSAFLEAGPLVAWMQALLACLLPFSIVSGDFGRSYAIACRRSWKIRRCML